MTEKKVIAYTKSFYWAAIFAACCGTSLQAQNPSDAGYVAALSVAQQKLLLDSDGDGLPDSIEKQLKLNPLSRDSNHDGITDGNGDMNHNGVADGHEFKNGKFDTDSDGISDEDDDDDDDDSSRPKTPVVTPTKKPVPLCKKARQKNCYPLCKRPHQKKCYRKPPKKIVKPTKPVATPAPVPSVRPPTLPTPAPTAVTAPGNFDSNGNTTKFGIPSGLIGNVGRAGQSGQVTAEDVTDRRKTNRNFSQIKGSMSISAMRGIILADSQLADLVVYLNRSQK